MNLTKSPERLAASAITAVVCAVLFALVLLVAGCEGDSPGYCGDADLVALCEAETAWLEAQFGCTLDDRVYVGWGASSMYSPGNITIWEALRGTAAVVPHVRHECLHALAHCNRNSGGMHPEWINGVKAVEIVPSWEAQ